MKKDSAGIRGDVKMKVTSHKPDSVVRKATVQGKEVNQGRIDSARKANPGLNKALGKAGTNRGGQEQYRDSKADLVNAALKRKSK